MVARNGEPGRQARTPFQFAVLCMLKDNILYNLVFSENVSCLMNTTKLLWLAPATSIEAGGCGKTAGFLVLAIISILLVSRPYVQQELRRAGGDY